MHVSVRGDSKWALPRFAGVLIALCVAAAPYTALAALAYAPPDDSPDAASELTGIERELADRNFASAARRLDALLAARADHLVNLAGDGTLTAVSAWADQLPRDRRDALAGAYASAFGQAAADALGAMRKARDPSADDLYALARRYPMTPAAGAALALAGDRAIASGDLAAAQAFYELATRGGASLDAAAARRLESIRRINAGAPVPAPADLPGAATTKPAGRLPYAGPLPFDASWFGDPSYTAMAKFFPVGFGDRVALSSWNGVRLLGPGGDLVWSSPNPQPPGAFPTLRPVRVGRGALFAPAALTDVHGRGVILVTREPSRLGPYVLRALGAADGKTLWATTATDPRDVISYVGLPAVAGRYVYGVAVRRVSESTAELLLSALDVTRGTILWQTPLGSVAEQADQIGGGRKNLRPEPLDYSSFAELSEPAVAGDLVIVSPNCGATIALGRFDGRVRWVAVYRAADVPNARALRPPPLRWATARDAAAALRLRYRSTPVVCEGVVVAMPQDAPAIFAFDRAGGRRLWESDLQPAETFGLAGASGNMAILCGADAVYGLDAAGTGKRKWRYTPPKEDAITGPAAVLGQAVIVPTTRGPVQLDAADGKERPTYDVANWRRLWQTPGGRHAVDDAGASRAFGAPSP